tara:strand:- start:153 stop:797 length:645 start_codon:yes stop_codon:yes gene_type:complete
MATRIGKYKASKEQLAIYEHDVNSASFTNLDLGGTLDVTGAATLDAAATVGTTLGVTGIATFTAAAQFNGGYAGAKTVVDLDGATATPTVAQSGTIFTFDGTACTVTLPTCAAGLEYIFLVKATGAVNSIITTQSADKLYGVVPTVVDALQSAIGTSTFVMDVNTGTNDDTFTMNGGTKGGVIGSYIRVFGMAANAWHISGFKIGSGTLETSFS